MVYLNRGLTTAVLKLVGTMPVVSDKLTIFNIVGPRNGQRSLISLVGQELRRQVFGWLNSSLDKVSKEMVYKHCMQCLLVLSYTSSL